jgi:hypothetical protein
MAVYSVHAPRLKAGAAETDPARIAFVRDGFHFWAFVLGPIWMLFRRLWLVLLLYIVLVAALGVLLFFAHAGDLVRGIVTFCVALLVGLEAGNLRRWTLERRKWRTLGFVVGADRDAAERRFFSTWSNAPRAAAAPPPADNALWPRPTGAHPSAADEDIVGLFPQPRGAR